MEVQLLARETTTSRRVSTRWSLIGRIVDAIANRAAIRAVTSDSGEPVGERPRSEQVGRQVEVAQPEPRGLGVEAPELLGRAEGLVAPAPPAFAIEGVAEPVGDRVEVRTHPEAVHVQVVAGVHDRRDIDRRHRANETAQELPRADTSGECDDFQESRA